MGGLGLWVRSEWRSGWRALLGLAMLIALGAGVTLAALAGARRADTAIDRFQDAVATPIGVTVDASMDTTQLGDVWDDIAAEIAARPWRARRLADGILGRLTPGRRPTDRILHADHRCGDRRRSTRQRRRVAGSDAGQRVE